MPAPRHENSGLSFENRASKHQNQNIRFLPLKRFCKTVSVRKADLVEREIFVRRFPNLPCLPLLLLKQNLLITGKALPLFSWSRQPAQPNHYYLHLDQKRKVSEAKIILPGGDKGKVWKDGTSLIIHLTEVWVSWGLANSIIKLNSWTPKAVQQPTTTWNDAVVL